jgi:hypothetical protein
VLDIARKIIDADLVRNEYLGTRSSNSVSGVIHKSESILSCLRMAMWKFGHGVIGVLFNQFFWRYS